MNGHRLME